MSQQFSSQSTDSFRKLLDQAKSSLLVSTYQAGQLVIVRAQEKSVNTHFLAMSRPMGIATKPNEFSLGGNSTISVFRNLPAVGSKTGQGKGTDACFLNRRTYQTGAIDIHEMGYDSNNTLWFVNTKMSCLCTLHDDFSFVPQWKPPFISTYDLTDRCHLNGLGFRDGKPRYVSMLGAYDTAGGWRQNKVSGGQIMDIQTNEVIVDGLCMPHSPRWYQDKLYFLSSGAGQLMSKELGKPVKIIAELPGFARGMDFIEHYALIGLSQIRESSTFAGLPLTKKVDERQSGVWVVNLNTGETVAFLKFTGNVQEVFDIKVVPYKFPTIIEESNPLLISSYELPNEVLNNLAAVDPIEAELGKFSKLHAKGQLIEAIAGYKTIVTNNREHRQVNIQLGMCYVDAKMWKKAIAQLTLVINLQADNVEIMNKLGLVYMEIGDLTNAMSWFERSISTDKQFAMGHYNRGLLLLKLGKYSEAWPEYDWRLQTPKYPMFQCEQPQWQGEDIRDKRLLIKSELSASEQVQFLRFLPIVSKLCKELIYVGNENLSPLVAGISEVTENRSGGKIQKDRFDIWCPLTSLPRWLGITLDNLPTPKSYLSSPTNVVVTQLDGCIKVGLVWRETTELKGRKNSAISLKALSSLFNIKGITFYSLQKPITTQEVKILEKHQVANLEPELSNDTKSAMIIDQLDLVISVDSIISHIAGALGVPNWVALSSNPDWHWSQSGQESKWYPSHKLYRKGLEDTDWKRVISVIKQDLSIKAELINKLRKESI